MLGTTAQKVFNDRRAVKTTHDIMANFLSSLEGEEWKRVRQLIAPTFSDVKLRSLLPIMRGCADRMLATLSTVASKSDPSVDLKDLFGHYTMDVIARTAFGAEPDQQFVEQASALFTFPFWRKFLDYVVPMWILDPLGFTVLPKVSELGWDLSLGYLFCLTLSDITHRLSFCPCRARTRWNSSDMWR